MSRTRLYELKRVDFQTSPETTVTVFVGTWGELFQKANAWGYRWRDNHNIIFGGYFVNKDGECLFVDIHVSEE